MSKNWQLLQDILNWANKDATWGEFDLIRSELREEVFGTLAGSDPETFAKKILVAIHPALSCTNCPYSFDPRVLFQELAAKNG